MSHASALSGILFQREVVCAFMRQTQETLPVDDFPPSEDPAWRAFWDNLTHDPRFRDSWPAFDVKTFETLLEGAIITDQKTKRIHLFLDGPDGTLITGEFPAVAHELRKIGWECSLDLIPL